MRVLYLFSGLPRKGSLASWLRRISKRRGQTLDIRCIDIRVKPHYDLTKSSVRRQFHTEIMAGKYFGLVASPPCSTFSRACCANRQGPRPCRSYVQPRGLSRLTWSERKKVDWGNTMADFTFSALKAQAQHPGHVAFFENPEDLGAVRRGPWQGQRPASMWQFDAFNELTNLPACRTVAFHQHDFGTPYPKPTRLLLLNVPEDLDKDHFSHGPPSFDDQGYYAGPLTQRNTSANLQRTSTGFGTTGSEQWPSDLCKWVAFCISNLWIPLAGTPHEGELKEGPTTDYPVNHRESDKLSGGTGPCRQCRVPGRLQ